jgi:histidinol-phosphate phosphatase family protein
VAPASANKRPGVLLDRDGTIIFDHGYVGSVDRVELIPGAASAIAKFNSAGVPVAVLTNQSGVARGYFGTKDVEAVHEHISKQLARSGAHVDLYLYCPCHPDGVIEGFSMPSERRKPSPGMALEAADALLLDLCRSWVVGDRPEDMALASAVGAHAAWVGRGVYADLRVRSFASLADAAPFILGQMALTEMASI